MEIRTPATQHLVAATHGLRLSDIQTPDPGAGETIRPQPVVHSGQVTKNYFKDQIGQAQAQAAQIQLMIQANPSMADPHSGLAATLSDLQRNIANYTKAMAKAPDKPGMFVMYS